uniref:Myosin motor domain-containing protein n=1 Tax=Hucho hucho TaxID=62062 RepID=A0A4W5LL21_9TELE
MLALINEESRFPKGTDYTLLEKLHSRHATNPYYMKPRVTNHQFGIKHYAGEVNYPQGAQHLKRILLSLCLCVCVSHTHQEGVY